MFLLTRNRQEFCHFIIGENRVYKYILGRGSEPPSVKRIERLLPKHLSSEEDVISDKLQDTISSAIFLLEHSTFSFVQQVPCGVGSEARHSLLHLLGLLCFFVLVSSIHNFTLQISMIRFFFWLTPMCIFIWSNSLSSYPTFTSLICLYHVITTIQLPSIFVSPSH